MRPARSTVIRVSALALLLALAACGQGTASSPDSSPAASPSADAPSPSSSPVGEAPSPTAAPSDEAPAPAVVEHPVPIIALVTEDGVEVRTQPRADAPNATAEDLTGSGETPEVVLGTGDAVIVTLGPVVADGESWYEVSAADGSELHFAFGWIPGRLLDPDAEVPGFAEISAIHGQGEGAEVSTDALRGTPVTVRVAATTMTDGEACTIDVAVFRTDGTEVNVATDEVTDVLIFEATANQMPSLFQETGGTVTLQVESDCSFAATMIAP